MATYGAMSHLPPAKVHDLSASPSDGGVVLVVRLDGHSLHLELTREQAASLRADLAAALGVSP